MNKTTNTVKKTDSPSSHYSFYHNVLRLALGCAFILTLFVLSCCRAKEIGSNQEKGESVDLRALPALGLKWTERRSGNGRFISGVTGGWRDTTITKAEVIASTTDTITAKSLAESTETWWGDAYQNPGSDSAKTRLTIRTLDRCGKVLSSEGASADDGTESPFPDRPIQLGESFTTECEGNGIGSGKRIMIRYTLIEVITVNNRRMAVLNIIYTGDMNGQGTEWRDLHTGLIVKSSLNATAINDQGFRMSLETDSRITEVNGEKWLD
jgi:hypothetical protein